MIYIAASIDYPYHSLVAFENTVEFILLVIDSSFGGMKVGYNVYFNLGTLGHHHGP